MRLNFRLAIIFATLFSASVSNYAAAQPARLSRMQELNPAMPQPLKIDQDRVAAVDENNLVR